jgi:hypothetical protein
MTQAANLSGTGICKAWVNYNGSTQTVNNSFNVSSVTRNGTGDYTINFTTAMPNTTYSFVGTVRANGSYYCFLSPQSSMSKTTSALQVAVISTAATFQDTTEVNVAVFSS